MRKEELNMVMLRKVEGRKEYKAIRKTKTHAPHREKGCKNKTYRDWWFVKARGDSETGTFFIGNINTPKELVGKKIEIYARVKDE